MRVYAESNFILELVLEQQNFAFAEQILSLAENGELNLKFPVLALLESFRKVISQAKQRSELYEALLGQFNQIQRSRLHQSFTTNFKLVIDEMQKLETVETASLQTILARLFNTSNFIDMTRSVFEEALNYQIVHNFSYIDDALIYAAIISDLQQQNPNEAKCFLNRDTDFDYQSIKAELTLYNCRYIAKFDDGLNFIKSELAKANNP